MSLRQPLKALVIGGVVLNRLNVCWFGLLGALVFVVLSQVLPVFPETSNPSE